MNMDDAFNSSTDWASSDDLDLDELLHNDDAEMMIVILAMKELEDHAKLLDGRTGSTKGRLCILREPRARPRSAHARLFRRGTDLSTPPIP